MDKTALEKYIKENLDKKVKDLYPYAKKQFNISMPTFYKYYNAVHTNGDSDISARPASDTTDKTPSGNTETSGKKEITDIKVSEEPISSDKNDVIVLNNSPESESETLNQKETDKKKEEKVETAEIIGIVVDLLDMGYSSAGLTPMSENEKTKGYEYSEAIANKRINISSENADIYNLGFWIVKSIGIRVPQILQKMAKPKQPQQMAAATQEAKSYNNMSAGEIMAKLNKS